MDNDRVKIIAEIGINHNGDLSIAKKLVDVASFAGCDYVKFQKREPDICVPEKQRNVIRETPWGKMSYIDYRKKIEFGHKEYQAIDKYCREKNIGWFASVWDLESVDFMKQYVDYCKIPSAHLTNNLLLRYTRENFSFILLSTGMSTEKEIVTAVELLNPDVIFHTISSYPASIEELNLNYIKHLQKKFINSDIGYSGHEFGLVTTFAAVGIGAKWIERHITLERTMWGSDQMASVEPHGVIKLVKGIRDIEKALGNLNDRNLSKSELEKKKTLRL